MSTVAFQARLNELLRFVVGLSRPVTAAFITIGALWTSKSDSKNQNQTLQRTSENIWFRFSHPLLVLHLRLVDGDFVWSFVVKPLGFL